MALRGRSLRGRGRALKRAAMATATATKEKVAWNAGARSDGGARARARAWVAGHQAQADANWRDPRSSNGRVSRGSGNHLGHLDCKSKLDTVEFR